MHQRIENKREAKPSEVAVTVMFRDRTLVFGGYETLRARETAAPSLPEELAVIRHRFFDVSSPSGFVNASPERRRARSPSLPQAEKFPAEGPMARSALAVSAAEPNTRSPKAAATEITTMTEQRRCAAA